MILQSDKWFYLPTVNVAILKLHPNSWKGCCGWFLKTFMARGRENSSVNAGNCSSLSVVIHLDVMKEEKNLASKVDVWCLQTCSLHTLAGGAQPLPPEGAAVQAKLSSPQPGFFRRTSARRAPVRTSCCRSRWQVLGPFFNLFPKLCHMIICFWFLHLRLNQPD